MPFFVLLFYYRKFYLFFMETFLKKKHFYNQLSKVHNIVAYTHAIVWLTTLLLVLYIDM